MDDAIAFAEELEEVALQLSSLNPLADDPEEMTATVASAVAEYERLSMTAAMYGMEGVQQTVEWVHTMLASFQATLPEAILELLQGGQLFTWLELAAIALREPEEPTHLPTLTAALLHEDWPEPPAPIMLETLLLNLRQNPHASNTETPSTEALHTETPAQEAADIGADHATATPPPQAVENPLAWDADIHPELLAAYLQETPGQVAEATRLLHLIANGSSTPEQKRHASRLAHTIKGASGVVGVEAIASFTHRLEDLLDLNIARHLPTGLGDTLGAAADCLATLFDHLLEHKPLPDEYPTLLAEMDAWGQRIATEQPIEQKPVAPPEATVDQPTPAIPVISPDFLAEDNATDEDAEPAPQTSHSFPTSNTHLSVPIETVQRLLNLAGELITSTSQVAEHAQHTLAFGKQLQQQDEHIRQMLETLGETIGQQSANRATRPLSASNTKRLDADGFDQLEMEAYNDLHSAASLLTESVADNRELTHNLQQQIRQISEQIYRQQRLQRQLSEAILRTRLVPVQSIVARVERTVRETCRRTGKTAKISIQGQNLQIDTDILQGLTAPLLHMLRNAVDHGIEAMNERKALGKDKEGHIELRFEQKGGQIHLTLSDDGQGLDTERIRARAIERGLVTAGQTLGEEDVLRLILQPGFTTRDKVSEISGRGVGMDVVQSAVENLQGLLQISSIPGQGTSIRIQVPLTLLATNALLVRTAGKLVAIPGNTIHQLLYAANHEHIQENDSWFIHHQEQKLEVIQLARLLGWQTEKPDLRKGHSLLLVESEHKLYALHVDEILPPRDIVIKSLTPWLNLTQGVSGACILANGSVAAVLDLLRLLRHFEHGTITLGNTITANDTTPQRPHILVVDDSLSNRKSLSLMLENMGYHPITAIDGLNALQHLHEQPIQLILTDLEMPRMNGLEMAQAIRIWPEKRHIPIIMVTSRSTQKHRQMAQEAGIDDYLTKPVNRETLQTQLYKWLRTQLAA